MHTPSLYETCNCDRLVHMHAVRVHTCICISLSCVCCKYVFIVDVSIFDHACEYTITSIHDKVVYVAAV